MTSVVDDLELEVRVPKRKVRTCDEALGERVTSLGSSLGIGLSDAFISWRTLSAARSGRRFAFGPSSAPSRTRQALMDHPHQSPPNPPAPTARRASSQQALYSAQPPCEDS